MERRTAARRYCSALFSTISLRAGSTSCNSGASIMSILAAQWRSFSATVGRSEATVTPRSEEHTSELQSLMRISYAVFCLKKKKKNIQHEKTKHEEHETRTKIIPY